MSIGNPSIRVSTATRRQHWRIDEERKRAPIPRLIWNDGHMEYSRVYWFKEDDIDRVGKGQYSAFGG